MSALSKLDDLARSLESEAMRVRFQVEAYDDGVLGRLELIVIAAIEKPEVVYGFEAVAASTEAAVQILLDGLDAGGLEEARAFRDKHRRIEG